MISNSFHNFLTYTPSNLDRVYMHENFVLIKIILYLLKMYFLLSLLIFTVHCYHMDKLYVFNLVNPDS